MRWIRERIPSGRQAVMPGIVGEIEASRSQGLKLPAWHAAKSAKLDLLPEIAMLNSGLVLDLGTNVGDWTADLLRVVPSAHVIAVEPGEVPRRTLHERFAADLRVSIEGRAVAGASGSQQFHVTEHSHNAPLEMDGHYGHGWVMTAAVPVALKKAKPGTPEFRAALRDAIEGLQEISGAHGIFSMSPNDHLGLDQRARVMVKIENGAWKYQP